MYLSLNGVNISNDGYVLASGIGEDDGGLLCITDRSDCCRSRPRGEWSFPNGSLIEIEGGRMGNFFFRNRGTGVVRLNRRGDPRERGRFRCEIPDANDVSLTMYVNIGEWFVSS